MDQTLQKKWNFWAKIRVSMIDQCHEVYEMASDRLGESGERKMERLLYLIVSSNCLVAAEGG